MAAQELYEQQQENDSFRIDEIMITDDEFNVKYRPGITAAELVTREEREHIRSVVVGDAD